MLSISMYGICGVATADTGAKKIPELKNPKKKFVIMPMLTTSELGVCGIAMAAIIGGAEDPRGGEAAPTCPGGCGSTTEHEKCPVCEEYNCDGSHATPGCGTEYHCTADGEHDKVENACEHVYECTKNTRACNYNCTKLLCETCQTTHKFECLFS